MSDVEVRRAGDADVASILDLNRVGNGDDIEAEMA
ncbi:MAG: hypothetical protein QOE57_2916, partial [Acidimicrobiaceae bacterium]|nr:hypothetical protein [Acidimicrobiaceae bacterium]